jgi:hypothetical protein
VPPKLANTSSNTAAYSRISELPCGGRIAGQQTGRARRGTLLWRSCCTATILEFLATTKVGLREQVARPLAGAGFGVQAEDDFVAEDDAETEDGDAVFARGEEPWSE